MQPSDVEVTPPHAMRRIEDGPILRNQSNRAREGAYPEKLKSIVVSPKGVMGEGAEALESAVEVADDEETLQNFQSKTKSKTTKQAKGAKAPTQMTGRKRGRPSKPKPTVASPNQLTGASSKKRILSLIQHSPGRARRSPGAGSSKGKSKQQAPNAGAGPSEINNNPKIKLIPATKKKKKEDFQVPPPQGP
ncbi:unnamed protein product [Brassica rapa subsp. trilocularis]